MERMRERSVGRGTRTLTQATHASRDTLSAHATATAHAGRPPLNAYDPAGRPMLRYRIQPARRSNELLMASQTCSIRLAAMLLIRPPASLCA